MHELPHKLWTNLRLKDFRKLRNIGKISKLHVDSVHSPSLEQHTLLEVRINFIVYSCDIKNKELC